MEAVMASDSFSDLSIIDARGADARLDVVRLTLESAVDFHVMDTRTREFVLLKLDRESCAQLGNLLLEMAESPQRNG
jgi:hypothetical protein